MSETTADTVHSDVPEAPLSHREIVTILIGLMLGIGVAFLREFMDSSVRTREDLQNFSRVPVLGVIPRIKEAVRLNGRAPRSVGPDSGELETRLVTGLPSGPFGCGMVMICLVYCSVFSICATAIEIVAFGVMTICLA